MSQNGITCVRITGNGHLEPWLGPGEVRAPREGEHTMMRVLVVGADVALAEMMSELLTREGSAVTVVGSIGEAVSRFGCYDVDMVILDPDTVPLSAEAGTLAEWRTWLGTCASRPLFVVVSVHGPSASQFPLSLIPGKGDQEGGSNVIWLRKPFRNHEFLSLVRQVTGRTRLMPTQGGFDEVRALRRPGCR